MNNLNVVNAHGVTKTSRRDTPKLNLGLETAVEIVYNDIGYNDEPDITTEL